MITLDQVLVYVGEQMRTLESTIGPVSYVAKHPNILKQLGVEMPVSSLTAEDEAPDFEGTDNLMSQAVSAVGLLVLRICIDSKGSSPHMGVEIIKKAQVVKNKIQAITLSEQEFTLHAKNVSYVNSEDGSWAAAAILIEVGSYDYYSN